ILRCPVLEGQDGGILDDAVTDLDGPTNGGVRVPSATSIQDRAEEGKQRLAVLPGRGVPQIRRALVDGVIEHSVADFEDRGGERRGTRPAESHGLVTGDVDDQSAGARDGAE